MNAHFARRDLLKSLVLGPWFARSGLAGRWLPDGDAHSVIVLELEGGNDGLATLVPVDDPALPRVRKTLAEVRKGALAVAPGFALHPALAGVHRLVTRGQAAFVHAVGYPRPDRSHFRSRDVWHSADPALVKVAATTTGWLGRAADLLAERGAAVPALAVGGLGVPLVLRGARVVVPSLDRVEDYQVVVDPSGGREAARRERLQHLVAAQGGSASWLTELGTAALANAERMRGALASYAPKVQYPDSALGRKARLLAQLVVAGFGTRLFHLGFGGFDTHARQAPAHDALLRLLDGALTALVEDLGAHGALGRVTILVHSEFGRRVAENASLGTDHGAAAPVLVLGGGLRGPVLGEPPSLDDLDDGDLRMRVDFRAIYAALLTRIGLEPAAVLGESREPFPLFA